jgi:predicted amidohydrolase YtcJ
MDLTTAIRMHTIYGAFASFEEGFKGSLDVGKAVDLVVLAEGISRVPVERLREVGVVMTAVIVRWSTKLEAMYWCVTEPN